MILFSVSNPIFTVHCITIASESRNLFFVYQNDTSVQAIAVLKLASFQDGASPRAS